MIIKDRPPLWDEIVKVFPVEGKPVIFSWGPDIYNPMDTKIGVELLMHESVHGVRQGIEPAEIETWWWQYLKDPAFRLAEEIPAHCMEYWRFCRGHASRDARTKFLCACARRLSSELYGSLISYEAAHLEILKGAHRAKQELAQV